MVRIILEDVIVLYFLWIAYPNLFGLSRHMYRIHNDCLFNRNQFPEIFEIFRENDPGIVATHHFLEIFRIFWGPFSRNIPNILEMLSSKYPEYFGKMVRSAIVEISGIFRKNGPALSEIISKTLNYIF